jgi:endonuclease/exonuclease/phosphatase family metal-dependent hydrolase
MHLPRILPLLAAVLGLLIPAQLSAEPLKLLSWNIEWFPGGNPKPKEAEKTKQTTLVEEQLAAIQPDIFLAQEITDEIAFEKVVSAMPGKLTMHVCSRFMNQESKELSPQQCAIASNLKADSAFFENFKPNEKLPHLSRGFAFAALEHPDGGLIIIYSVHLKSNRGSETPEGEQNVADTRAESVRQILSHKAEMEKRYTGRKIMGWLVGGDFNTNHDGQFTKCTVIADLIKAGFHNSWDKTSKEQRLTWHTNPFAPQFKPTTFDYIMTVGFKETQSKSIAVSREASDHDAVVLMLEPK